MCVSILFVMSREQARRFSGAFADKFRNRGIVDLEERGVRAIVRAAQSRYEVIVVHTSSFGKYPDLDYPGLKVLERLCNLEVLSSIIALTSGEDAVREAASRYSAVVLAEPVEPEVLVELTEMLASTHAIMAAESGQASLKKRWQGLSA